MIRFRRRLLSRRSGDSGAGEEGEEVTAVRYHLERKQSMNVSLPPELEKLSAARWSPAGITSASEVVLEALRLLEEQDLARSVTGG